MLWITAKLIVAAVMQYRVFGDFSYQYFVGDTVCEVVFLAVAIEIPITNMSFAYPLPAPVSTLRANVFPEFIRQLFREKQG
jgi:hypothetical protein